MEEKIIRIIATDGEIRKKLFFITYEIDREKQFVCGVAINKKSPPHTTYHQSGLIHQVRPDRNIRDAQPLNRNFKGSEELISGAFDKDLKQLTHLDDFYDSKIDEIIYIDIRTLKNIKLNISSYLIEPGNFIEIGAIYNKHVILNPTIHIVTKTNPWILILIM